MAGPETATRTTDPSMSIHEASRAPDPRHGTHEATTEEPPKKRRRVVKPNPDKKFECKHEGCGKSYSRAEHLYRHQLNRKCPCCPPVWSSAEPVRHSEDHLSLRLSRLQSVFCPTRPVHSPP